MRVRVREKLRWWYNTVVRLIDYTSFRMDGWMDVCMAGVYKYRILEGFFLIVVKTWKFGGVMEIWS